MNNWYGGVINFIVPFLEELGSFGGRLALAGSARTLLLVAQLVFEADGGVVAIQVLLLLRLHVFGKHALVEDSRLSLLTRFLDARLHPVAIVTSRLDVEILELLVDVAPDLTVAQVRVKLNDLHELLLVGREFMQIEAATVESAEDDGPDVERLGEVVHDARKMRVSVGRLLFSSFEGFLESTRSLDAASAVLDRACHLRLGLVHRVGLVGSAIVLRDGAIIVSDGHSSFLLILVLANYE